jgi:glycosyltransferase involved in cell wall biosynthesis
LTGDPPTVTAVIPAYNAEAYLEQALKSVLGSTYRRLECVVVDDGSTDSSAHIAAAFGPDVRLVRQANAGVAAARNRGAREGGGSLLAFLDADDCWLPSRIEQMVALLSLEQADAVLCATRIVGEVGDRPEVVRLERELDLGTLLMFGSPVPSVSSNLLIDRKAFERLGGFDERLGTSADWELLARIVTDLRLAYLDEPLVEYRRHEDNMSRDIEATERDLLMAWRLVFARGGSELRPLRRPAYARLHRMLSGSYADAGRTGRALVHALRSAAYSPRAAVEVAASGLRRVRTR